MKASIILFPLAIILSPIGFAENEELYITEFIREEIILKKLGSPNISFINVSEWKLPIIIDKDLGDGRYEFTHEGQKYVIGSLSVKTNKKYDVDSMVLCNTSIEYSTLSASTNGAGKNDCIRR